MVKPSQPKLSNALPSRTPSTSGSRMLSNEASRSQYRVETGRRWNRRSAVVSLSSATNAMQKTMAVFFLALGKKLPDK